MQILSIIGFLIILGYILVVVLKEKKIPESISAIVYSYGKLGRIIFTLVMFTSASLMTPYLFEICGDEFAILALSITFGFFGVGCSPLIDGERNTFHYVSAILMGISSQFMIWSLEPMILLLWTPYVVYTLWQEYSGKNMFFAELVMIIGMLILCCL